MNAGLRAVAAPVIRASAASALRRRRRMSRGVVAVPQLIGEESRPQLAARGVLGREPGSRTLDVHQEPAAALSPRLIPLHDLDRELRRPEPFIRYHLARFLRNGLCFRDIERKHALTPDPLFEHHVATLRKAKRSLNRRASD